VSLLIKNGRDRHRRRDALPRRHLPARGETITKIGTQPRARPKAPTVVDASGKYVFPGFVDPHVHIHLPFMGTVRQGHAHHRQPIAALVGGTTTFIEMACAEP
jgi:dihydropyrimidinase